ncbi:MAG: LysR family transcriptional regulator [Lachnospiraceae bacterium]|nr:LysR family transcriptional regulator [Lachnospiraceae bacterium]
MDLGKLQEFLIVAEEKSFKKAAERLNVAPNVLSTRMHIFEDSLNTQLIRRVKNGLELTDAGKALLPNAETLLKSYTHTIDSLNELKEHIFQSLCLQFCSHMMASELGPYLDIFCRRHPQLILNIYDENTCQIRGGLFSGKVDVSFVICRKNDFEDISGRVPLSFFPNMYVHLPSDHTLANEKKLCFSDLSGETFILYPHMTDSWVRDLQLSILDQSGIDYQIYEESCSPLFQDLLVPIGKGIRLWNWREKTAPNSVLIPIEDKGYDTWLYMLYNTKTTNPAVVPFINGFLEFRSNKK